MLRHSQSKVQRGELPEHRQLQQQVQPWCESFRELNDDEQQM